MQTIEDLLGEHPFLAGLDRGTIALLSGCAANVHARPGEYLFRQGEDADHFYIIRYGVVAVEVHQPARGPIVIDTLETGETLGFSWLVEPYRYLFDARAVESTSAVSLDGVCLRAKCEADPRLGHELLKRVTRTMYERLHASRVRMLDLYGTSGPGATDVRAR
jgi:CRP-like cAMP-binding protein